MAQHEQNVLSFSIPNLEKGEQELRQRLIKQTADIALLRTQLQECDEILVGQDQTLWRFCQQIRERDEAILVLIGLIESGLGGALDPIVVEWRCRLNQEGEVNA